MDAAVEATAAEMEEGAEARVEGAPAVVVEETKVPQGCRCAMIHICMPCNFGTGKTHEPSWQGQSYPQSRVIFFVRSDICADCDGRNAIVKTGTFPPP